jgi:type IX secretion system PorP/SprF family membrane protein
MKKTYKYLFSAFLAVLALNEVRAQDPEATQFYANPLYLNPALAGTRICPRVSMGYRAQWPGIYGTYSTTFASVDRYSWKVKGGLGLVVMNDRAAQGTLNTTGVGVIYAPVVPLGRNASISTAIQVGYWQKAVNWNKLTFGDQIDSKDGFIYNTLEVPGAARKGNFDLSAGMVFNSKSFFIGAAVHHILEPNESLMDGYSKLPRKYTVHAGAIIPLNKSSYSEEAYISPNIMYRKQADFEQLNLGMYAKKGAIVGGLWYRGRDAFIMLVGIETGHARIGYSYDVTISKLTNASAGAHEISLGWQFTCKKPRGKVRLVSCPSF